MKPVIKNKVAFFSPTGFLDGENASDIISPLDIKYLLNSKLEGAFISLKRVIFFNKRGITVLIESLQQVSGKCGTIVGFCDYDVKKYRMILEMFADTLNFSLFDTAEIACLFIGDDVQNAKEKNIVINVDQNEQKHQIAMELYERGFAPIIPKDENDFLEKRKDAEFVIENAYLGQMDKTPTVFIKDNVIVYTLKGFVDSSFDKKFDMRYHKNSLTVGFQLFLFDCDNVSSINVHGVNFISKLSTAGAEYGATILVTGINARNITNQLKEDLEDAGVLIYPSMKALFEDENLMKEVHSSASVAQKHRGITKRLVSVLPTVTESVAKTIEVLSGHSAQKKSIKIEPLCIDKQDDMLSVSIGFYGDIEGIFILISDKTITKETCKILLDEENDDDDLLEAFGEFVHIIGGKIIQKLHKKNIKVGITMPRTFDNVKDVIDSQQNNRGAQVDLSANGYNMTLFLTR